MNYFVYLIKSINFNWHYVGFSSDIEHRLYEHNHGLVRSTKHYLPFKLLFVELTDTRLKVRDLEKYLKVRSNKEALLLLI